MRRNPLQPTAPRQVTLVFPNEPPSKGPHGHDTHCLRTDFTWILVSCLLHCFSQFPNPGQHLACSRGPSGNTWGARKAWSWFQRRNPAGSVSVLGAQGPGFIRLQLCLPGLSQPFQQESLLNSGNTCVRTLAIVVAPLVTFEKIFKQE